MTPYHKFLLITLLSLIPCGVFADDTPPPPAAQPPATEDVTDDIIKVYEKSVVMILAVRQDFDYTTPWKKEPMSRGIGTGFVIDGNRILTNAHNIANARYLEVKKQYQARRYPAQILYVGHDCDLALITVADSSFFSDTTPLSFGTIPHINSTVQTCGFPMGGQQLSITEGVVSRVETGIYSHSQADSHVIVQTDAAINPGNSGGPVLQDGKVVGVAFQGLMAADNIGYMIPTTVIEHFLTDVKDGTYNGFGSAGVAIFEGLHNPSYKTYLKIPDPVQGVVVTEIIRSSTADGILQKDDVITKIDDFDIDNDGTIQIDGLRLELAEVIDRKQIGQTVKIQFYRDGQLKNAEVKVALNAPVLTWARIYDNEPKYQVYAGLTFVTISRNYLEGWGKNWLTDIPFPLRYLFMHANQLIVDPDRKEFVVLSEILPDEVNTYITGFKSQVVETVNGIKINKLQDLTSAFEKDIDGYWIVTFMNNDSPMILDATAARQWQADILKKYQVPAASN